MAVVDAVTVDDVDDDDGINDVIVGFFDQGSVAALGQDEAFILVSMLNSNLSSAIAENVEEDK